MMKFVSRNAAEVLVCFTFYFYIFPLVLYTNLTANLLV